MKKGISLILLIIMILVVIILGYVCVLAINNNSSFFNIKQYKKLKADIQLDVNNIIYNVEEYMGRGIIIESGYITDDGENLPKLTSSGYVYDISVEKIPSLRGENLNNIDIYLDENGVVTLQYLFFKL